MEYPVDLDKVKHLKYKVSQLGPDDIFEMGNPSLIDDISSEYYKVVRKDIDNTLFKGFSDCGYDKDTVMKLISEKRISCTRGTLDPNLYTFSIDGIAMFTINTTIELDETGMIISSIHNIIYII